MGVLSEGTFIGRYRVEAFVGQGGMGVVYRALDPALDRRVALKLLAPHLLGEADAIARFHREATAVANLKHPNIAAVYEFGQHDGQPFIATEWIEGKTLAQLIAQHGRLSLIYALFLFDQLANGLDYSHDHGVVHRDFKPSNILISPTDHATIVDFGLAWVSSAPSITVSGSIFGTPRYMAPEQIEGKKIDGRADQYALACVLYEMLAGRPPFDDESTPALLYHQLYEPPPFIHEFAPAVPVGIQNALCKALAKNPADRFPDARSFGAGLHTAGYSAGNSAGYTSAYSATSIPAAGGLPAGGSSGAATSLPVPGPIPPAKRSFKLGGAAMGLSVFVYVCMCLALTLSIAVVVMFNNTPPPPDYSISGIVTSIPEGVLLPTATHTPTTAPPPAPIATSTSVPSPAATSTATASPTITPSPTPAYYSIANVRSGLCLGVYTNPESSGAAVAQDTCLEANNQKWEFLPIRDQDSQIRLLHSGMCLDIDGGAWENDGLIQRTCDPARDTQLWQLKWYSGNFEVVGVHGGLCVELPSFQSGRLIQPIYYGCNPDKLNNGNQRWVRK